MRATSLFFLVFLSVYFGNSQEIYEGKKILGYRVYMTQISNEKILMEVGGTSLKMGGRYIVLNKERIDDNTLKYSSPNSDSYVIKKRNKCYKFYYKPNSIDRKFKLKKVTYSDEIDTIRFNIFRAYDHSKNGNWRDVELLQEQFSKFKNSPSKYINDEN
jgi:hypothetical protein